MDEYFIIRTADDLQSGLARQPLFIAPEFEITLLPEHPVAQGKLERLVLHELELQVHAAAVHDEWRVVFVRQHIGHEHEIADVDEIIAARCETAVDGICHGGALPVLHVAGQGIEQALGKELLPRRMGKGDEFHLMAKLCKDGALFLQPILLFC